MLLRKQTPEKALDVDYIVQANYYVTSSQTSLAPANLHLIFYTNFGSFEQTKKEATIRLGNRHKDHLSVPVEIVRDVAEKPVEASEMEKKVILPQYQIIYVIVL